MKKPFRPVGPSAVDPRMSIFPTYLNIVLLFSPHNNEKAIVPSWAFGDASRINLKIIFPKMSIFYHFISVFFDFFVELKNIKN
jgi:hypothetical protein